MLRLLQSAVLAIVMTFVTTPAPAQITKAELKCGTGTSLAFAQFFARKAKCVQKCVLTARPTSGPYTDCFAPYGGATAACLFAPQLGVGSKARAKIIKRCAADCPECYAPGVCSTGDPFVANVEIQTDVLGQLVYCVEANAGTPTKAEAKCEDVVSRAIANFAAAKIEFYEACFARTFTGGTLDPSCFPPASDPKTANGIARIEGKATAKIDAACSAAGANPACYVSSALDSGAAWVGFIESALDGQVPNVACGSPSGAFLD